MTKILLVDDSEDVLTMLTHRFEALNFEVHCTRSASDALDLLRRDAFDIILSDVIMPGMNGVEFMDVISRLPGAFQIIFMSGAASEETGENLVKMGAMGFFKKPVNFDDLIALINRSIGSVSDSAQADSNQGKKARVLIVDDMVVVADLLKTLLQMRGFEVLLAHNGEEALDVFGKNEIDLVVTDLVMPKMNGVDLIIELKKWAPDLPIMAITGEAMNLSIQDALNSGASMCIRKPFPNRLFVEKVEGLYMENKRTRTRQQAVVAEEEKSGNKLSIREKFHRDPVKALSLMALMLFSFLLASYIGTYAFIPARDGQSVTDIDDRMDQLIEAIRMDWGR